MSKRSTLFLTFFVLVFALLAMPQQSQAAHWRNKKENHESSKDLKKMQQKKLARALVSAFLRQDFFKKRELPIQVVLAKFRLEGEGFGLNHEDYTNLVLNELLNHPKIFVLNQDLTTDLSMRYRLMNYKTNYAVRQQGVFLGAEYYVSGRLESLDEHTESGKLKRNYFTEIQLRRIRSNQLVASFETQLKSKNKKKSRRR